MKTTLITLLICTYPISLTSCSQETPETTSQKTWTFTYLKAKANERKGLKEYLIKNWLAMDSIALSRGLINDYRLFKNAEEGTKEAWDYIVAVEYLTAATFSDIQEEWQLISENHIIISIDGKELKELGAIVRSETVVDAYKKPKNL